MQDDDHAVIGLESAYATLELVTVRRGRLVVRYRVWEGLWKRDLHASSGDASLLVTTGVEEDPVEPRFEAFRVAQRGQVPPAPDERLLHSVLCQVGVAEDEACRSIQSTDRGACQHREGVMIAPLCSHHEIPLHVRPLIGGAATLVALE